MTKSLHRHYRRFRERMSEEMGLQMFPDADVTFSSSRVRVRIRFIVWLFSGYAHVFLLSVCHCHTAVLREHIYSDALYGYFSAFEATCIRVVTGQLNGSFLHNYFIT